MLALTTVAFRVTAAHAAGTRALEINKLLNTPVKFGGFDDPKITFQEALEQLAKRFAARGHEVVVYCRPHVVDRRLKEWRGARLVHLPTVRNKYLDTFVHTFLSALHAAHRERPDVALFFIAGNSPMCLITRGANIPTVINVDGLDSDRRKWPAPAQRYLRLAERTAPLGPAVSRRGLVMNCQATPRAAG